MLDKYYYERKSFYDDMASDSFFAARDIEKGAYYLSTCHRRENVEDRSNLCSAPGSLDTSLSHAAGLIEIAACHA